MEVTKYLVKVKVDDSNYIYINTLNGAIDILNSQLDKIVTNWQERKDIKYNTKEEKELYDFMLKRNYIVYNDNLSKEEIFNKLREKLKKKQREVKRIALVLTYDCNFRCKYCYEDYLLNNGEDWLDKTLSIDMVNNIYKQYGETISTIGLFGGEPLLLKNFDLINHIFKHRKNANFHIITNGYYLEEYTPLLQKYKITNLEVTLDGTKNTHNERRYLSNGKGTYDKIIRGIEKAFKSNLRITVRVNIDNSNESEVKDLYSELLKLRGNKDNLKIFKNPLFNMKKSCVSELINKMIESSDGEKGIKLNESIEAFYPISKVFKGSGNWQEKYVYCQANDGTLFFDPHGDVYTCWLAVGDKNLKIGNHYPKLEIDKNNDWHNRTVENIQQCSKCNKALLCGGGCGKVAYDRTGSVMSNNCYNTNFMLSEVIPSLYRKYFLEI